MRQRDMCTTHCAGKYSSGCIVQQEFLFANIANRLHQRTDLESPSMDKPQLSKKRQSEMNKSLKTHNKI